MVLAGIDVSPQNTLFSKDAMVLQMGNGIGKALKFSPKALCFHDLATLSRPLSLPKLVDYLEEIKPDPMRVDVTGGTWFVPVTSSRHIGCNGLLHLR